MSGPNLDKIQANVDGVDYVMPPPSYQPPKECTTCHGLIYFANRVGGHKWDHLTPPLHGHAVTIRKAGYFDTRTGKTVHGNPLMPS